ncbi:hypothetical protein J4462_03110 [Candidatus Pacearchaeota archaeon]|nr:hypothetical protein [Candidatus Pacearchaeota archaeon]
MAKEDYGKGSISFYPGADYGFDHEYGKEFSVSSNSDYSSSAGLIGVNVDPRTANQLDAVSKKLSTGAKTIEVQGLQMSTLDNIPKQHFKEIERLKKLVGADLTFHGPLVEPTGIGQGGWDPSQREFAERQIWSSVERAHDLDPKGNLVITFHSSNGLPEPRTRVKTDDGKEISSNIAVIDERTGRFGMLPKGGADYFEKEEYSPDKDLKRLNEQNWTTELSNVNISARRGREVLERMEQIQKQAESAGMKNIDIDKLYKLSNTAEWQQHIEKLNPETKKLTQDLVSDLGYANVFVHDSYRGFKGLFNQVYDVAVRSKNEEVRKKLDELQDKVIPIVEDYKKDSSNAVKLADAVSNGIRVLDSMNAPQIFKPLEEFAIDKASETFANVALKSYDKFRDSSPIISIENPPAGMGLSRAEDLKNLVEASRKKFVEQLIEKKGLSKGEANKQAEKLIGTTWDLGHINMIRKYGYSKEDVVEETKKIAPYVKHIHLSDNFGMEHTELPMGMGNVPTKAMIEAIEKYNKQLKKIAETGTWFGPQAFGNATPFRETLRAFGSPIYSMKMAPYWSGVANTQGAYFSGYGRALPEQHFNLYGAGFSNLPTELGGQMEGRSRMGGGTPNQ